MHNTDNGLHHNLALDSQSHNYRVKFTIFSTPEYAPISILVSLPEREARILMATPVKSVSISIMREHGMIIDQTPQALEFHDGGNVPK